MSLLKSILVTAMGFILGVVLAGVGGLSAETLFYRFNTTENTKKAEKYWSETNLGISDVEALISNAKCGSSDLYYRACLNAVVQNLSDAKLKLSKLDASLIKTELKSADDELSEKELLENYLQMPVRPNFAAVLKSIFSSEEMAKHSQIAGAIINSFMSIYFDPHTYILPTAFYNQVGSKIERSKFFVGLSYEKKQGDFYILRVAKNSDAEMAGLKSDDRLISINRKTLKGLEYSEVSQILKNEKTKFFQIKIQRGSEHIDINFERSYRLLSHVQFNQINDQNAFGLLTLSKFSKGVCQETANLLKSKKIEGLAGLILDLRDNPGGQLDEAACMAGLFLGKNKKAYYIEYFDETKPNELVLTSEVQLYKGPLVVLVNSRSASASESLSGALKDYKRAIIIGRRTFGKGTFQEPEEWLLNPAVSLFKTQGFYLLPSRTATQAVGIKPDIEMPNLSLEKREENSFYRPLQYKAKKYPPIKSSELVRNPVEKNCGKDLTELSEFSEDLYLRTSLNLMNCSVTRKKSLAQAAAASIN